MPNIGTVLKDEISRLARKEIRAETGAIKKAAAQYRRDIAALKRQVKEQARKIAFFEAQESRRLAREPSPKAAEGVRFSPGWVKRHRQKLGLSAADYARLVGVSALTIYSWEQGKSRPRAKQLAAWGEIRNLGKREALQRLEMLGG
jgi:DNA-binding transcriptional regulator YiaG